MQLNVSMHKQSHVKYHWWSIGLGTDYNTDTNGITNFRKRFQFEEKKKRFMQSDVHIQHQALHNQHPQLRSQAPTTITITKEDFVAFKQCNSHGHSLTKSSLLFAVVLQLFTVTHEWSKWCTGKFVWKAFILSLAPSFAHERTHSHRLSCIPTYICMCVCVGRINKQTVRIGLYHDSHLLADGWAQIWEIRVLATQVATAFVWVCVRVCLHTG